MILIVILILIWERREALHVWLDPLTYSLVHG